MKRNATIAAITAAVLIGGTAAATVAFADDDGDRTPTRSAGMVNSADAPDDRAPAAKESARITLDQAVAAALKSVPGTVTEAELDDDDDDDHNGRTVWELDVHGSDKKWHDVTVDATTGKVLKTRQDDDNDDRDRHAPRSAPVTLNAAADAALKTAPGRITSIDLDDDDADDDGRRGNVLRWDVDITGKDGKQHELRVDAKTGKVTVDRDDDDRDSRGGDADDRNDD
ncbi:PepSY domain-containing protein [Streptomyces sp. C11-1]|uniref:PepSY domain-containing protein n=1 Tax=Streptomyces durocortorensis TaxID=2811104 RepID=A0ABY9W0Y1_9ACTN|nr:PepSY domain-containing protein [Streptomyces durocortorensis]WNF29638.1 PepSY domain-containing protein [Streptomyces durocortorensis]